MTTGDPRLADLHGLRVKGFAELPALAELTGLAQRFVSDQLDALAATGMVAHREGGWSGRELAR